MTTYAPNAQRVAVPGASRMLPPHVILRRALIANPNRDFVMYSGTPHERTIRYCPAGSQIDSEWPLIVEAMQSGIYMRAELHRDSAFVGHRWLFLCRTDDLEQIVAMDQPKVGDLEVQGLAVAAAFWSVQLS